MSKPELDFSVVNVFNGVTVKKRITLPDAKEMFLSECELRDLSSSTIANYSQQIGKFEEFCVVQDIFIGDLKLITREHVEAFQGHLKKQGLKNTTINAYCQSNLILFENMIRKGYTKENPFKGAKLRKGQQHVGYVPSKDAMKKIINYQVGKAEGNFTQFRNLVILLMFADTGVRVLELCELRKTDIHISEPNKEYVSLNHTKNSLNRKVGLSTRLVNLLKAYLPLIENYESPYLFNSKPNKKLSKRAVQVFVSDLGKQCGYDELSPHSLRRFYASTKIAEDVPLIQLMRLLGHSSPEVTLRYYKEMDDKFLDYKDTGI